ncbi:hypothetical protein PG997_010905 [Apiospora hydei]|uniref:Uncharacterized protein n=1 Tax=Apiospora hydei TaxID=1337664 RepID=A0ABR1VIJ3_9PEZI
MSRTHVESALEEQTITNALEDLSKVDKVFYDAYAHLRRTIKQSIKAYTTFRIECDDLILQRDALIRDISAIDPEKALHLQDGTDYAVPGVLFEEGDTLLSIKTAPKRLASPEPTLKSDDASGLSVDHPRPNRCHYPRHRGERRTARAVSSASQQRPLPSLPPPPPPPPPPSTRQLRERRKPPEPSSPAIAIAAAAPSAPSLTIKTDHVTKEHYWVFDLPAAAASARGRDRTALYTLRCPAGTCDNPVFSKHPPPPKAGRATLQELRGQVPEHGRPRASVRPLSLLTEFLMYSGIRP